MHDMHIKPVHSHSRLQSITSMAQRRPSCMTVIGAVTMQAALNPSGLHYIAYLLVSNTVGG